MTGYGVANDLVLVTLCALVTLGSINYACLIGSLDNKKKDYVAFFLIFAHLGYAFLAMNTGDMISDSIPAIIFVMVFTPIFYVNSKHHDKILARMEEELHKKDRLAAFR